VQREEILDSPARKKIFDEVSSSPGLHFRELQRRTNLAVGMLQHHLEKLKKVNFIVEKKEGKFSRFYAMSSTVENSSMGVLRQPSTRKIILFLMKKRMASLKSISKAVELTPSTAFFHLKKLVESNVVVKKQNSRGISFAIVDKQKIFAVLNEYKKSFLDEMVDSFIELWEKDLK
jgi:predicted transcriptional regulator